MLIKCLHAYRGTLTAEELLEEGKYYRVPDVLGEALLRTHPQWFERVTELPERLKAAVIAVKLPVPEPELPEAVAEAAGDETALLAILKSRQRRERRRLAKLEEELGSARQEWERLAGMKVSGEATKRDLAKLEEARQRVRELEMEVEESKAAQVSLAERIAEVGVEIAKKRLEVHVQEFDRLIERYKAGFASFCQSAIGLVDQADALYSLASSLDCLSGQIKTEAGLAGQPVDQRYLEGASGLPRPRDLKVDKYLVPRRKGRQELIRQAVAKFGES